MVSMPLSLGDWGTERFKQTLQQELEGLRSDVLPLQQAIGRGNRVYDHDLGVAVMQAWDNSQFIAARFGVFFAEVISCVSCGEGEPVDEAYCEMEVRIDKQSGEAQFSLLQG